MCTDELYAIMMALEWIRKEDKISQVLIGSDLLSAVLRVTHYKSDVITVV